MPGITYPAATLRPFTMSHIKKSIKSFFFSQSFAPGFAGVFINPFYFIRSDLQKNIKQFAPELKGRLLDFGCGRKPYENLFSVDEYIGIDLKTTGHEHKNSKVDVYYDGKSIPFDDNNFDSVFCSEVLEHVFNLDEVLPEIRRVMKPNGKILVTVPFCWNEHEVPFDFGRYSSFGIAHLFEKYGFKVTALKKSGTFARVIMQLYALYWYSVINTRSTIVNYLLRMFFIAPVNVIGSILLPLFPKNDSMYFNNIVIAQKVGADKETTGDRKR
jgi:SAM-dependent methyltransferase